MSLRVSYFKLVDFFLLDAKWYLMINKDVAASGLKAHYHFFYYGWREGRLSHKTTKVDFLLNSNLAEIEIDSRVPDKDLILVNYERFLVNPSFKNVLRINS